MSNLISSKSPLRLRGFVAKVCRHICGVVFSLIFGETFDFPNPINQNTQHFYTLRSYLGLNTNFFRSIVVFSDLSYIDTYKNVPYHAQVCQLDNLIYSMNKIAKRYDTTIEEHMVESIYENLINLVEKTEEKEKEHIERIKLQKE
jgi:hypothetical protein